jgi:large subunit ribosomal protein L9
MRVFLQQDVPGVGKANEIKNVSDGYARNYLIPRGLAIPAAKGQVKAAEEFAKSQQMRQERIRERSLHMVERLKDEPLRFKVKAGETGRLYGSITSADVAKAIARKLGMDFDKHWVLLERPIRDVGTHLVDLKLEGGVRGQAQVVVEAEAQ